MRGPLVPGAGPRVPRAAWALFCLSLIALGFFAAAWVSGGGPGALPLGLFLAAQSGQRLLVARATSVRARPVAISSRP